MTALPPDQSTTQGEPEEVFRARPGIATVFLDRAPTTGAVALARRPDGCERPLTVEDVTLLSALATPAPLPRALLQQIRDCGRLVEALVLDGLVEVRRDGRFLSGVKAATTATVADTQPGSRISELALQYALVVRHLQPTHLAQRLYAFNSLPRRSVRSRKDAAAAFADETGIDAASTSPHIGGCDWQAQPARGWLYLRRGAPGGSRFKLYLCPHPKDMARVLPDFARALARARGSVFKIAFPVESCVRADKIVAYFSSFETLQDCVAHLLGEVEPGVTAQQVPFTASIAGQPLLSWGADPPAGHASGSWRSWVTRQIAECVQRVPATLTPGESLSHLKAALRLRDIDPVQWLPQQQLLSRKWSVEL